MKSHGSFSTVTRHTRTNFIHGAVRDELIGFWWTQFCIISHMRLDSLTLDFCEATYPDGCCLDLPSKLAWMLPKPLYGEPKELKIVANVKDFSEEIEVGF